MKKNPKDLTLSKDGELFIKEKEGWRSKSYDDGVGVWTIGWGTTRDSNGKKIKPGMEIDTLVGNVWFHRDRKRKEKALRRHVKVNLTQGQFDALLSFIYNFGETNFRKSTLLRVLNEGKYNQAAHEFLRWNKGRINGKLTVMKGLVKRRKEEKEMFLYG